MKSLRGVQEKMEAARQRMLHETSSLPTIDYSKVFDEARAQMKEAQRQMLQSNIQWPITGGLTNPWDVGEIAPGKIWANSTPPPPKVLPDIHTDAIRRYAEAGVPFPLDKDGARSQLFDWVAEGAAFFGSQNIDEGTLHITNTTKNKITEYAGSGLLAQNERWNPTEAPAIGLLHGLPVYLVDDESQQGIFAPLQPFYRFTFI